MSDSHSTAGQPCRALWIQVVTQAKGDLEDEPTNSVLYDQAMAFFAGGGRWAESRAFIANLLEMHPDDLFQCGQRWIAARRIRDGVPPEPPPVQRITPTHRLPLVALPRTLTAKSPPNLRHRISLTVVEAQLLTNGADPILHKVAPASRRKKVRRHWTDIPGATNPFAQLPHRFL